MGATQSTSASNHVFSKELENVNRVVNMVINSEGKFVNPNYNFLFEDVCRNYTILWQKELGKHLKVELENLTGSVYLLPKRDIIISQEDNVHISKQELCTKISKHYVKILYLLTLIKYVYDLENHGDNSIAGITKRNLRIVDGIMEINFCSIPQKDYQLQHTDKISFESLEGLDLFVNHFLTPTEKYAFLEQFKAVVARKPQHKIVDAVCLDSILPLPLYEDILAEKLNKRIVCTEPVPIKPRSTKRNKVDLMFEVVANNPILHSNFCMSKKKLVIPLDSPDPIIKQLKSLHTRMQTNHKHNIHKVELLLHKLVDKNGNAYELKNISGDDLHALVKEVKQTVVVFYIQSIVDFHLLLDVAQKVPSVKLYNK